MDELEDQLDDESLVKLVKDRKVVYEIKYKTSKRYGFMYLKRKEIEICYNPISFEEFKKELVWIDNIIAFESGIISNVVSKINNTRVDYFDLCILGLA